MVWDGGTRGQKIHGDIDVVSAVLNLRISYRWRPILNDGMQRELDRLAREITEENPVFIILGNSLFSILLIGKVWMNEQRL
jgi:hypothetical protein